MRDRAEAEAEVFLAFRPWLLLVLVLVSARLPWRARWAGYGLALPLAATGEALLLHMIGSPAVLAEAARGVSAGAALVLLLDAPAMATGRLRPAAALPMVALAGLATTALHERIALPHAAEARGDRPVLLLHTGCR